MNFLLVFFGGGIGSMIRYLFSISLCGFTFPISTLLSNFFSCLIYGFIILYIENLEYNKEYALFFVIGVCGGLSTFSTFSYESINLIKSGYFLYALLNVLVSVLLCFSTLYFVIKKL